MAMNFESNAGKAETCRIKHWGLKKWYSQDLGSDLGSAYSHTLRPDWSR